MNGRTRFRAGLAASIVGTVIVGVGACNTTLQGSLSLITGPDDGFAQNPKPTSLVVQLLNSGGTATTIAHVTLPADGGVTLPAQSSTDIDIIQVTGLDADGGAVVSGSTIPVALDELSGITLNLFVQRTGQFSRLPSADGGTGLLGALPSAYPLLTTLYSRYLLIADGTGRSNATQLYDTLTWQVDPAPPPLPIVPLSLAYVDTFTGSDAAIDSTTPISALLTLGANGTASWLDLTDSTSTDAEVTSDAQAPPGGSFANVAGGQTIVDSDDGSLYIVGATRQTGKPTSSILHISASGVLHWATLSVPRLGAAATYVPTQGLYVFGGNMAADGGSGGFGAELLTSSQSTATQLDAVPSDPTAGAGAVALDPAHVLVAGGSVKGVGSPVRLFTVANLTGGGDAGTTVSTLPVSFVLAQVFALTTFANGWSAIVVGTEKSGATSAYKINAAGATLVPFKVPRSKAQAIVLPNGSLGVVGGDAATMESFIP